jgi:hypothetical protein
MHAFNISALLTMIAINKLTERTRKNSGNDRKRTQFFFPHCKNDQCGSKNTHAAVPDKLTINFVWPIKSFLYLSDRIYTVFSSWLNFLYNYCLFSFFLGLDLYILLLYLQ